MIWLTPADLPRPVRTDYPTAGDFMLADNVWVSLQNPQSYFLAKEPQPEYANPQAYVAATEAYAQSFAQHNFPVPYVPPGWDAKAAAQAACADCFNKLAQLPVNAADPDTWSVLMAWIMGTGQLYGGHPIKSADTGLHPETGQDTAPVGSVL